MNLNEIKNEYQYNVFYNKFLKSPEIDGTKLYRGMQFPKKWADFLKTDIARGLGLVDITKSTKEIKRHTESDKKDDEIKNKIKGTENDYKSNKNKSSNRSSNKKSNRKPKKQSEKKYNYDEKGNDDEAIEALVEYESNNIW